VSAKLTKTIWKNSTLNVFQTNCKYIWIPVANIDDDQMIGENGSTPSEKSLCTDDCKKQSCHKTSKDEYYEYKIGNCKLQHLCGVIANVYECRLQTLMTPR